MDRQNNGQRKKGKKTNNNLQNTTQKTKIEQHEPHKKTGGKLRCQKG